jgi:hypothetical protein
LFLALVRCGYGGFAGGGLIRLNKKGRIHKEKDQRKERRMNDHKTIQLIAGQLLTNALVTSAHLA